MSTAVAPRLDPMQTLDVLLASEGNLDMACEVLGTPANPAPKAAVVKALMDSPADQLHKALRLFSLLEAHDLRRKVKLIAEATLGDLEGPDAIKAYNELSDQVQELTKAPKADTHGNVFQFMFDNLPREASQTIKGLARLDPQAREELRRIAHAKNVGPVMDDDDDGAASAPRLPSPAASARPDEERGITVTL